MELRLVETPDQEMSFCSFNETIQVSLDGYSAVSLGLRRARPGETLLASRSSLLAEHLHERDGDLRLDERGVLGTLDALPESCDPLGSGSVRPR